MYLTFFFKKAKSKYYKSLGEACQSAAVGHEMEELHFDNVSLKSKKDVQNLIKVLKTVEAGFIPTGPAVDTIATENYYKELIRRTD